MNDSQGKSHWWADALDDELEDVGQRQVGDVRACTRAVVDQREEGGALEVDGRSDSRGETSVLLLTSAARLG